MLRLKELRKEKHWSQEKVAKLLNITQATFSGWENEKFEIDNKNLLNLANIFNVSVDYLLGRSADRINESVLDEVNVLPLDVLERYGNIYEAKRHMIDVSNSSPTIKEDWESGKVGQPNLLNHTTRIITETESKLLDNYRSLDDDERQEVLNFIRFKKTQKVKPFTSSNTRSFTTVDFEDDTERIAAFGGIEENDDEPLTT